MHPLSPYGWADGLADEIPDHLLPGRVVRVDRGRALAQTTIGTIPATVPGDPVVTGDWVGVDVTGRPEIRHVVTRRTVITRYDTSHEIPQPLAANVDAVLVVHGLDLGLKLRRMERALVVAWDSGARPIVVLSKADLAPGGPSGTAVAVAEGEFAAVAPGVEVVTVSAVTGLGVDRLRGALSPGETVVVLGESGVGKSTLVNALAGEDLRDTGPTRVADRRGRHTTTARELVPLPDGLILLDTPGIRTLGVWDAGDGLAAAFSDVEEAARRCRFRDCRHDAEPGCGVRSAVDDGSIDGDRLASYRRLEREMARMDRRRAAVEGRVARRTRRRSSSDDDWRRDWGLR
ncbi:MAG: ribosome small subunit-dependent GTPase A [Acidimicrobiia bacterium]|nr:ribosome small subunit-dependent GTPase A [Acidimicrobiia bacterium]